MSVLMGDTDESASVSVKVAISYLDSREPSTIQISFDPQTKISDLEGRVRSQLKGQIMRDRLTDPNAVLKRYRPEQRGLYHSG